MMFWYDHNLSGWSWFAMVAGMIVPWLLVAALIVWLLRTANRPGPRTAAASPERILAQRYARGEIDRREYEERRAVIRAAERPSR